MMGGNNTCVLNQMLNQVIEPLSEHEERAVADAEAHTKGFRDDPAGRAASVRWQMLIDIIRKRFPKPKPTLDELRIRVLDGCRTRDAEEALDELVALAKERA